MNDFINGLSLGNIGRIEEIISKDQFIGLNGKNDKEVYEGDILKDEYGRILLVEWWKCGFSLKAITETNFIRANEITQWFEGDTPRPEVIGNIYKNPELLQKDAYV